MKKLFILLFIPLLFSGCNKKELSNSIIPNPNERFESISIRSGNMIQKENRIHQDDFETDSLIISNDSSLLFTPDTIRVPVGTQVQLYSNVNRVYGGVPNIYGEWRSHNIPGGQVTRHSGMVTTNPSFTGVIRITYTCGVIGTNLPNYQTSTRILVY